jgi:hypothetical protein
MVYDGLEAMDCYGVLFYITHHLGICFFGAKAEMSHPSRCPSMSRLPGCCGGGGEHEEESGCGTGEW